MPSRQHDVHAENKVHLRVNGDAGSAGSIEFFTRNTRLAEVFLPPQQFQIIKWLSEEARNAAQGSGSTGFVASDVLARKLYNANLASDYGKNVAIKAVYRLRKSLKPVLAEVFARRDAKGRPMASDLIESRRHFGYRLTVIPPDAIHVPRPRNDAPPAGLSPPAVHIPSVVPARREA